MQKIWRDHEKVVSLQAVIQLGLRYDKRHNNGVEEATSTFGS